MNVSVGNRSDGTNVDIAKETCQKNAGPIAYSADGRRTQCYTRAYINIYIYIYHSQVITRTIARFSRILLNFEDLIESSVVYAFQYLILPGHFTQYLLNSSATVET